MVVYVGVYKAPIVLFIYSFYLFPFDPMAALLTMAKTEHVDQVRLVMHLRTFYPEVLVAAVPNGAAVSPHQRMRLVAEGLLAGFPDLFIAEARGSFHGLFVEMKVLASTGKGKAVISEGQARVHKQLRDRRYCVVVCFGYIHAKEEVIKYLTLGTS